MNTKIASWIFFLFVFTYTLFSAYKISTTFAPDFSIFYYSAKDVLQSVSPYADKTLFTAFNYPLATSFLFIPLTILPYKIAQAIFTCFTTFSVFCCLFFCIKLLKKRVSISFFLFAISLVFLSFPTKFTMGMGQTNLVAYVLLLLGFLFLQKNKTILTALTLVVAILLKPILGTCLILLFFEKKWKSFLLSSSFLLLVLIGVPFIYNQSYANGIFLQNILSQTVGGREVYYNQGLLGFISRITNNFTVRKISTIIGGFLLGFAFVAKSKTITLVQKLSLLLTFLVIIDPLSWQHHFVFLLLPFLSVFFAIQKQKKKKILLFTLFTLSYLLVSWNIKNPSVFQQFPLSLILSNQLYGALILFLLQLHLL